MTPEILVTTYIEMTSPSAFEPAYSSAPNVDIVKMEQPDVDFYRFLYKAVGDEWCWRDRLLFSDDELHRVLAAPETSVYVMYVDGTPAGYIELCKDGRSTEIAYFGIRRAFMGRGLGKHLLSYGIQQAWNSGTRRVWLHTCNLDGPHALNNYLKRGFAISSINEQPMPERYFN